MKGLELSRRFFLEWGLPVLKQSTPDLLDQMPTGLATSSVDMWSSLQAFAALPPPFMGNQRFIKAIYEQ